MYKIQKDGFNIVTDTEKDAFDLLLKVHGYTKASFSEYMGIEVAELDADTVPTWALNYLIDLLNINLVHLGYIMKDTKVTGLLGIYDELIEDITEAFNKSEITGNQPITINKEIIREDGAIKAYFIVNTEYILKDFLATAGQ